MKVYVLINSYEDTIEGVFTHEGKLKKDKERLEAAHILRVKSVESLCKEAKKFRKAVDGLNQQIMSAFQDISPAPSDLLNTIAKRDMAVSKLTKVQEHINRLNQLNAEEVIHEFGVDYWEVQELQGD